MAKAELIDGTIIDLPRNCQCVTHRNPHWVHMDIFHEKQNQKLAEPILAVVADAEKPVGFDSFHGIATLQFVANAELRRLGEKRCEMEKRGIVKLIAEPNDEIPLYKPKRPKRKKDLGPELTFTGDRVVLTDAITGKMIGA